MTIYAMRSFSQVYAFIAGLFDEEDAEEEYLYFADLFAATFLERFDLDIKKSAWYLLHLMEICQLLVRLF